MIPKSSTLQVERDTANSEIAPTKTYKIDWENGRIIGVIDDREAVVQFIRKMLSTDKYAFEIYNWYYGHELSKLVGKPYEYVITRIPELMSQALRVDDRIIDVRDFTFNRTAIDYITVSCVVDTVYGPVEHNQEVSI